MENVGVLVVGINNFANFPQATLRGCVQDARDMGNLFLRMFPQATQVELVDKAATSLNIMYRLGMLLEKCDTIYFSMSSHGSRVKDRSGDEKDKLDGAYICHDTTANFSNVIVDEQLGFMFDKYPNKKISVWLDTCHSGEGLRMMPFFYQDDYEERRIKFNSGIAKKNKLSIYQATGKDRHIVARYLSNPAAFGGGRVWSREYIYTEMLPHVVLHAACKDTEMSCDAFIDGAYHGAFTHFWLKELAKNGKTSRKRICQDLAWMKREYGQTPGLVCTETASLAPEF